MTNMLSGSLTSGLFIVYFENTYVMVFIWLYKGVIFPFLSSQSLPQIACEAHHILV